MAAKSIGIEIVQRLLERALDDLSATTKIPRSASAPLSPAVSAMCAVPAVDPTDDIDWFFADDSPPAPPETIPSNHKDIIYNIKSSDISSVSTASVIWSDTWLARGLQHSAPADWTDTWPVMTEASSHLMYPFQTCNENSISAPMLLALNAAVLLWGIDDHGETVWDTLRAIRDVEPPISDCAASAIGSSYLKNAAIAAIENRSRGLSSAEEISVCHVVRSTGCHSPYAVSRDTVPVLVPTSVRDVIARNSSRILSEPSELQYIIDDCCCMYISDYGSESNGFRWQLGYEASQTCQNMTVTEYSSGASAIWNRPLDKITLQLLDSLPPGCLIACSGAVPSDCDFDMCATRNIALVHFPHIQLKILAETIGTDIIDDESQIEEVCSSRRSRFRSKSTVEVEMCPSSLRTRVTAHWNGNGRCDESLSFEYRNKEYLPLDKDSTDCGSELVVMLIKVKRCADDYKVPSPPPMLTVRISAHTDVMCDALHDRFWRCMARVKLSVFDMVDDFACYEDEEQADAVGGVVPGGGAVETLLCADIDRLTSDVRSLDHAFGSSIALQKLSLYSLRPVDCDHRDIDAVLCTVRSSLSHYITMLKMKIEDCGWVEAEGSTRLAVAAAAGRGPFISRVTEDMLSENNTVLDCRRVVSCVYSNALLCVEQLVCSV